MIISKLHRIKAGSGIVVWATVYDTQQDPPVLFAPSSGVKLSIRDSAGTLKLTEQAMTAVSTGLYRYRYQTATTDATGIWTGELKVQNSSDIDYTSPAAIAEIT